MLEENDSGYLTKKWLRFTTGLLYYTELNDQIEKCPCSCRFNGTRALRQGGISSRHINLLFRPLYSQNRTHCV